MFKKRSHGRCYLKYQWQFRTECTLIRDSGLSVTKLIFLKVVLKNNSYSKLVGDIWWPQIWRAACIYSLKWTDSLWLPTLQSRVINFCLIPCDMSVNYQGAVVVLWTCFFFFLGGWKNTCCVYLINNIILMNKYCHMCLAVILFCFFFCH